VSDHSESQENSIMTSMNKFVKLWCLILTCTLMTLTVTSYNSHGLGVGRVEYIAKLITESEIIFIQEHWLYERAHR